MDAAGKLLCLGAGVTSRGCKSLQRLRQPPHLPSASINLAAAAILTAAASTANALRIAHPVSPIHAIASLMTATATTAAAAAAAAIFPFVAAIWPPIARLQAPLH